ncbi:ABC transporter substrate-binding protein [Cellulomonas wangsupingiae]|uniref:ABC transporter substrate-binding protein n=1 Tax=Cellulomonas wangsupingiae TaxID=2968085 RepID=UPI001D0E6144|nr:extracellular solute-binding protein [Cellulomonas wangsupingiae]MCM0640501.1 extracellular solute-binding protein [Cellulomonas wangsupingiae]
MSVNRWRWAAPVAVVATGLLAACSGGSDPAPADSPEASGPAEPVTIEYWSGLQGTDALVDEWNAANPDIQVKLSTSDGSWAEQFAKLMAAQQAGDAPCMMLMPYDYIPSLLVADALAPVTEAVAEYEDDYLASTWELVNYAGETYGVPSGSGPMAMYYRADKFAELGIEVPTTWQEFEEAAKTVTLKAPGTYLIGLGGDSHTDFVSLTAQKSSPWFEITDDSWKVDVTNADSRAVAEYWQGLRDEGLLNLTNRWDPTFYNDLSEGRQLSVIGGAWQAPLLAANVSGGAGQWAIAPMPNWEEGDVATSMNGGGAQLSIKGCEHPAEAMKFANWLTTDMDAILSLKSFPAMKTDAMTTPDDVKAFFGGAEINQELAEYALAMRPWRYSPTWTAGMTTLGDSMSAFKDGTGTLTDLLETLQAQQIESMEDLGITVTTP